MKTVEELVQGIIDEGCGVYDNDAGNGSGGPGYIDNETLRDMLDRGDFEGYEVVSSIWDDRSTVGDVIANTLLAHNHDPKDTTEWLLAEKVEWTEGCQNNPYRHYLLLWDATE